MYSAWYFRLSAADCYLIANLNLEWSAVAEPIDSVLLVLDGYISEVVFGIKQKKLHQSIPLTGMK